MSGGDLKPRLISGIAALLVVLPDLILGGFWGVLALAAVAAAWSWHEIVSMAMKEQRASAFSTQDGLPFWPDALSGIDPLLPIIVLTLVCSAIYFLFTAKTTEGLGDRWAHFVLGLAYVMIPLGLFASLRGIEPGGRAWLFAPLFAGWCGDIGGYFAGRAFGKHKMMPLVSPKKTWEGFAGGVALAIFGVALLKFAFVDPFVDVSPLTLLDVVVVGVLAMATGAAGDFVASMLKRNHGVKDSGRFLPGHGGMLDRIDAVMFAVPIVWLWAVVVRPLVIG